MSIYIDGKGVATQEDLGKTFGGEVARSNFDLNNLVNDTIFCDNYIPNNAPKGIEKWAYYICIGSYSPLTQFAIEAVATGRIYRRDYSGSPLNWNKWSLIHDSRHDINNLDQRITALESKLGGKNLT